MIKEKDYYANDDSDRIWGKAHDISDELPDIWMMMFYKSQKEDKK